MTTEHKDLEYLKGRFEDGDRPTGDDFARLIDSCHNTRQLTDVTITQTLSVQGELTVDGSINTRDVAADGAKLDSLDSFVRNNSDSWEETDHILAVSSTVETVSSVLSDNIYTLNSTLSTYIDNNVSTLDLKIDNNQTLITNYVDQNVLTLNNLITANDQSINILVNNNHAEINTRVDLLAVDVDAAEDNIQQVTSTVAANSANWGVDQHTNKLSELVDVATENISHGNILKYDSNDQKWYPATDLHGEGQHVDTFLELHDTSVSYTGASGQFVKVNTDGTGLTFTDHDTVSWDIASNIVKSNSANWSDHTDVTDLTNTVATNSANWSDHTDVTDLTNTVATNSASWSDHTDVTGLTSDLNNVTNTVATNSASWSDHTDVTGLTSDLNNVTNTVATNSASWSDHTDVTDLTNTVATNSANWSDHTDVTDLTNTVATNSASWSDHTDVTDLTNTVATNSASWSDHTDVTDLTNTVATNSANWAILDIDGKLVESQIPELSITQTYTVQNTEDVAMLNPVEGLQRGDIVIVTTAYDNLVAKQDNPAGVYDQVTKTYSGYSKLSRPDAYVTSVNNMYGNVLISSDDINDTDNTNKWSTQQEKDTIANLNTNYVNVSGDTLTGDLDTTANILSGGQDLLNVFWVKGDDLGTIGNYDIQGEITADGYATKNQSGDSVVGITQDVNVGGNILHIVNGIIVGVTDEV